MDKDLKIGAALAAATCGLLGTAAPGVSIAADAEPTWDIDSACKALRECGDKDAVQALWKRFVLFFGGNVPLEIEACRNECIEQLEEL